MITQQGGVKIQPYRCFIGVFSDYSAEYTTPVPQ